MYKNNGVYIFENDPLNITKWNEFHFDITSDLFKKLPLQDLYCLNNNINIRWEFMNDYWNYIKFNFSKCEFNKQK